MRRSFTLSIAVVVLALIAASGISFGKATPTPALKTYQFRCTDRNPSLHIVIYERDGKIDGGNMYFENVQVASLTAAPYGTTGNIEAKVVGNTADVSLQLFEDKLVVVNYTMKKREVVCQGTRKYQ